MRVKINGEQVGFSLQKERNLGEVARGIRDWLGEAGFLITSLRAGDRDLLETPRTAWEGTPIESVEDIDVEAIHGVDARIEHWRTLHAWLGMLADGVENPGPGLEELLSSVPETTLGMDVNPFTERGTQDMRSFAALFDGQGEKQVREWPEELKREAARLVTRLRTELEQRIREASQPGAALKACMEGLRSSLERLPEVSVLLQTGRDREAMGAIVAFTESSQRLISLMPFLPSDPGRTALWSELTPFLRQIISAFDAKDSILIGDLLEYEVAPRLERLLPLLEKCV